MIKKRIKLETIDKVKDFITEIRKIETEANLNSIGREYIVDAKSILGVLSLDTSQPLELCIYDDEQNELEYKIIFEKFGC